MRNANDVPVPPRRGGGFFSRHPGIRNFSIFVLIVVLVVIGLVVNSGVKTSQRQNALRPFYDTSRLHTAGPLGEVVRSQPLGFRVDDGTALRIL